MSGRPERERRAAPRAIHPADAALRDEVLRGLRATPKTLPPKLFYDARGARLFEEICEQPEYYPTRTELSILEAHVTEVAALAGPATALIEYGSGAGVKVRLLLDALERPAAYVPVDISAEQLSRVADEIAAAYPRLRVLPLNADYTHSLQLPALPAAARRVAFFPGSTIGNFSLMEAAAFLKGIRRTVGREGALILGVDRRKDAATLDAAYDDAAGVTAEFNLNMLHRLNREFDADFDVRAFAHRAFFNEEASRVEMHLVSLTAQTAHVCGESFALERGESIWTESSYKYDSERLEWLVGSAGFALERRWTDDDDRFWVAFLRAV